MPSFAPSECDDHPLSRCSWVLVLRQAQAFLQRRSASGNGNDRFFSPTIPVLKNSSLSCLSPTLEGASKDGSTDKAGIPKKILPASTASISMNAFPSPTIDVLSLRIWFEKPHHTPAISYWLILPKRIWFDRCGRPT